MKSFVSMAAPLCEISLIPRIIFYNLSLSITKNVKQEGNFLVEILRAKSRNYSTCEINFSPVLDVSHFESLFFIVYKIARSAGFS